MLDTLMDTMKSVQLRLPFNWVLLLHIIVVGPLLVFVGYNAMNNTALPKWIYMGLAIMGGSAMLYHLHLYIVTYM